MHDDELGAKVGAAMRELFPDGQATTSTVKPIEGARFRPWMAIALSAATVVAIAVTAVTVASSRSDSSSRSTTNQAATDGCDQTGTASASVTITLENTRDIFTAPCYYGLADTPITLTLVNDAKLPSGGGIPMRIIISPSDKPVIQMSTDQPGMFAGSEADGLFVSDDVPGPSTTTYKLDALSPGDYLIQSLNKPSAHSELIITASSS